MTEVKRTLVNEEAPQGLGWLRRVWKLVIFRISVSGVSFEEPSHCSQLSFSDGS